MVIGLDSGFFISLMKGNEDATNVWGKFLENKDKLIVSILTVGEILYFSYRVGNQEEGQELVQGISQTADVIDVNHMIVEKAAGLKAGRGIPYIDSIILATFMIHKCEGIHTIDRNHFGEIKNKGIQFAFWNV